MASHDEVPTPQTPYLGESRARVLAALQAADEAMGVGEIAEKVGLHPNTARFHLDALTDARLAERHREEREVPGRPRWLYSAGPGSAHGGRRSYELLAQVLTSYLDSQPGDSAARALAAGESWGQRLVEEPADGHATDADSATEQLNDALDKIGFAPEVVRDDGRTDLLLHHCPFREVASAHQAVVCSVHLGLMRGALDTLRTEVRAESLTPFVEPDLCVTRLSRQPAVR